MGFLLDTFKFLKLFLSGPENISKLISNEKSTCYSASIFFVAIIAAAFAISSVLNIPPSRVTADNVLYGILGEEASRIEDKNAMVSLSKIVGIIEKSIKMNPKEVDIEERMASVFSRMSMDFLKQKLLVEESGFESEQFIASIWPGGSYLGFLLEWHTDIRYADELKNVIDNSEPQLIKDFYEANEYLSSKNTLTVIVLDLIYIVSILAFALVVALMSKGTINIEKAFIYSCYLFAFIAIVKVLLFFIVAASGPPLFFVYPIITLAQFVVFQYWSIMVFPKVSNKSRMSSFLVCNVAGIVYSLAIWGILFGVIYR